MTRRRLLSSLGLLAVATVGAILVWWFRPGEEAVPAPGMSQRLTVYSTTDSNIFEPLIDDFERLNPGVKIDYHELDAATLYRRFVSESQTGKPKADLLISSAMDLQVRLVNDGYATSHHSVAEEALPDWARWRDEAFGISFEPIAMVFNSKLMAGRRIPQSRAELIDDLRADPAFWRGKVGTYDIAQSSTGYLLATQDDRLNSEFVNLVNEMGKANVSVDESTGVLLGRIARGDLAMGYNVLGSYAHRLDKADSSIRIVYPQDYTLALSRTAVIPQSARHKATARRFLDYLLSARGQKLLTLDNGLYSILTAARAAKSGLPDPKIDMMRPIALGPGLLVFLDERKRAHELVRLTPLTSVPDEQPAAE